MQNVELISEAEIKNMAWHYDLFALMENPKLNIRQVKPGFYNRADFNQYLKTYYLRETSFNQSLCQDFLRGKFNPVFSHN